MVRDPNDKESPVSGAGSDGDAQTVEQALADADVGETVTKRDETTIETVSIAPDSLFGHARPPTDHSVEIVDIERVPSEWDHDSDDLKLVFQSTWTKQPEQAIRRVETEAATNQPEPSTFQLAVDYLIPLGVGGVVAGAAWGVSHLLYAGLTINGQSVEPLGVVPVAILGCIFAIIHVVMSSFSEDYGGARLA